MLKFKISFFSRETGEIFAHSEHLFQSPHLDLNVYPDFKKFENLMKQVFTFIHAHPHSSCIIDYELTKDLEVRQLDVFKDSLECELPF